MNKNELPKLLKDRIDLKSITLDSINVTINTLTSGKIEGLSTSADTTVMIFTNFGMIEGKIIGLSDVKDDEIPSDPSATITKIIIENCFIGRNNQIEKLSGENKDLKLISDSSAIVLQNAIITPYANTNSRSKIKFLILFTDHCRNFLWSTRLILFTILLKEISVFIVILVEKFITVGCSSALPRTAIPFSVDSLPLLICSVTYTTSFYFAILSLSDYFCFLFCCNPNL